MQAGHMLGIFRLKLYPSNFTCIAEPFAGETPRKSGQKPIFVAEKNGWQLIQRASQGSRSRASTKGNGSFIAWPSKLQNYETLKLPGSSSFIAIVSVWRPISLDQNERTMYHLVMTNIAMEAMAHS